MKLADYWPHLSLGSAWVILHLVLFKRLQSKGNSMNSFLKAVLKEVYDLEQTGAAALSKSSLAGLLPLLIQDGEDLPAVIANWADAKVEFAALIANPAADADLIAYGLSLGWTSDKKVQAVVAACAQAVLHVAEDIAAILAATKV